MVIEEPEEEGEEVCSSVRIEEVGTIIYGLHATGGHREEGTVSF